MEPVDQVKQFIYLDASKAVKGTVYIAIAKRGRKEGKGRDQEVSCIRLVE